MSMTPAGKSFVREEKLEDRKADIVLCNRAIKFAIAIRAVAMGIIVASIYITFLTDIDSLIARALLLAGTLVLNFSIGLVFTMDLSRDASKNFVIVLVILFPDIFILAFDFVVLLIIGSMFSFAYIPAAVVACCLAFYLGIRLERRLMK